MRLFLDRFSLTEPLGEGTTRPLFAEVGRLAMEMQQSQATAGATCDLPMVARSIDDDDRGGFGDFLLRARQRRDISLEQIADRTKVSSRYLLALERGQIEVLPAGVYRRAILRAYAASVGLDPEILLERYRLVFGAQDAEQMPGQGAPPEPTHFRVMAWARVRIAIPSIFVASIFAIALTLWGGDQEPPRVPPLQQSPVSMALYRGAALPSQSGSARAQKVSPADHAAATIGAMPQELQPRPTPPVSASLTVMSTPPGARVTVDGIGWGITPLTIRHLPPGQKTIRVTKDGYLSRQQLVSVGDQGSPAAVRVLLAPFQ